jgi:CheY-like chemotaxis protein
MTGRVLVVDDDAFTRDLVGHVLRAAGHQVVALDGGAAAVRAVREERFDVVLMDCRMPGVDGFEAVRGIRALPGAAGRTCIVMFSADHDAASCAHAADAFISKPFAIAALRALVAEKVSEAAQRARSETRLSA